MAESLRIELARRADGDGLAEALRRHGLIADVVEDADGCSLDVAFADDEVERLYGEVGAVVEGWTDGRGAPLILTRLDGRYALRPPAD